MLIDSFLIILSKFQLFNGILFKKGLETAKKWMDYDTFNDKGHIDKMK